MNNLKDILYFISKCTRIKCKISHKLCVCVCVNFFITAEQLKESYYIFKKSYILF